MTARKSLRSGVVVMLATLMITVACSKAPDDTKIAGTIQSSFGSDSGLQGKQLAIQSNNGTVTLSGTVDNEAQREAASRYAAAAPGVKQVVNNLQVGAAPAAEAAQTQPAQPAAPAPEPTPMAQPAPMEASKPAPSRRHHRHRDTSNDDMAPSTVAHVDQAMQDAPAPPPVNTAAAMPPPPSTPPPPPPPVRVTIPSGTNIAVRLVDPIDSETAQQGQTFHATLNSPLAVDGEMVIPAGYDVEGHIVEVHSAGKFAGKSLLTLQLDRIAVGNKYYNISTDTYHREGSSRGVNTAEKVGAGSVIGAIIGGIAGGGKGAAIGAAAGGGVGGGVQAATKGQQIKLPSEFVLNFSLQNSLTVTPTTRSPHHNQPQLDSNQPNSDMPNQQ